MSDDDLLTKDEVESLILALAKARHREGSRFTRAEVEAVVGWAKGVRAGAAALSLVLQGKIGVDVGRGGENDGEIMFYSLDGS